MKCPNCGYNRQKRDDAFVPATECPSCGIVYSKHENGAVSGLPTAKGAAPPPLRPSVVDPESLKKAKDRVEKRLRDRLETPIRDERHAQTLELARKLTGKTPQNRQENMAQDKKVPKTAVEKQNPASEHDDPPSDDPLLLEDAIGVQLHNGQNDVAPETLDDVPPPREATSDKDDDEASANSNHDKQDAPLTENPNTDQPSTFPEDVKVETVLLESNAHITAQTSGDTTEPENWTTVDEFEAPEATDLPPAYIAATSKAPKALQDGANLKRLLPIVAWLILFSGVIGAVLSWTTISDVEAGVNIPGADGQNALPLGLLLGFAYLATGALGFAFFWVSAVISRQLKDIRRLLMVHPIAMFPEETGADQPDDIKNSDS